MDIWKENFILIVYTFEKILTNATPEKESFAQNSVIFANWPDCIIMIELSGLPFAPESLCQWRFFHNMYLFYMLFCNVVHLIWFSARRSLIFFLQQESQACTAIKLHPNLVKVTRLL